MITITLDPPEPAAQFLPLTNTTTATIHIKTLITNLMITDRGILLKLLALNISIRMKLDWQDTHNRPNTKN